MDRRLPLNVIIKGESPASQDTPPHPPPLASSQRHKVAK